MNTWLLTQLLSALPQNTLTPTAFFQRKNFSRITGLNRRVFERLCFALDQSPQPMLGQIHSAAADAKRGRDLSHRPFLHDIKIENLELASRDLLLQLLDRQFEN